MAEWPSNLPGPNRTISIQAGSNLKSRELESGRREVRRFGSGAPDIATVVFRLFNEDVSAFEYFFDRDANLGVNWFSAPWLSAMGYSDHKARILGYPKRKASGKFYSDYDVTLLIQKAVDCPDDTFWPSSGSGGSGSSAEFNETNLFANGEWGIWCDFTDFNRMFQDEAMTTPVTAANQYVRAFSGDHFSESNPHMRQYAYGSYYWISHNIDGYNCVNTALSNKHKTCFITNQYLRKDDYPPIELTMLAVVKYLNTGVICRFYKNGAGSECIEFRGTSRSPYIITKADNVMGSANIYNQWKLIEMQYTGNNVIIRVDGVIDKNESMTSYYPDEPLCLGVGDYNDSLRGYWRWAAMVNRLLTDDERTSMHQYVNDHFGLSIGT